MLAVMKHQGIMRPPRGLFAYPGMRPGFDKSHIALSRGICRFSGVAVGDSASNGTFVNLLTGQPGTLQGTPVTYKIDGTVGPAFGNNGANRAATFTGQSTNNDTSIVCAGIIRPGVANANQPIFASSGASSTGGFFFGPDLTPKLIIQDMSAGSAFKESSFAYSASIPYFIAVSCNASATNFVMTRLDTGQIFTSSTTGISFAAPNGTYRIGGAGSNHLSASAAAAACFIGGSFLHLQEMVKWASDPWSFWYPRS